MQRNFRQSNEEAIVFGLNFGGVERVAGADYFLGNDSSCRHCPWKKLFIPARFQAELPDSGGWSWQLLRGWYHEEKTAHIWSKPEAIAIIDGCVSLKHPRILLTGFLPNPAPVITKNQSNGSMTGTAYIPPTWIWPSNQWALRS